MPHDEADRRLTLIVPAHNRPGFVQRLLHFAARTGIRSPIVVSDSSTGPAQAAIEELSRHWDSQLDLIYHRLPIPFVTKLTAEVNRVATPYCCFWAHDDFQMPAALRESVAFLDQHPDFSMSFGRVFMAFDEPGKDLLLHYPEIADDNPLHRMRRWTRNFFCTYYGVQRTELAKRQWALADRSTDYESSRIIPEVMLGQLLALSGKIHMLDRVAAVYQIHDGCESVVTPGVQHARRFQYDYRRYSYALTEEVQRVSGLSRADAERAVAQSYRDVHPWTAARWNWLALTKRELHRLARQIASIVSRHEEFPRQLTRTPTSRHDDALTDPHLQLSLDLLDEHPQGIAPSSAGREAA